MSRKIMGGSVYPNHRLSPSGPVLSGEGGPIVQIGVDVVISTATPPATPYVLPDFAAPTTADILASKFPRSTDLPAGPPCSVTLKDVKPGNLIAAWCSFGLARFEASGGVFIILGVDDGAGGGAFLAPFTVQAFPFNASVTGEVGSSILLGPNPFGVISDVRIFPVGYTSVADVAVVIPAVNQVAILAAEIAKT